VTLLPLAGARGYPGPAYDVGELCVRPGCGRLAVHAHHLVPRSALRGEPYDWIRLPDGGGVVGNRVGLCLLDHDAVTGSIGGHRARIRYSSGLFLWEDRDGDDWRTVGPLFPQPPGGRARAPKPPRKPVELCPTCGHRVAPVKPVNGQPATPRKVKNWTLTVPDDAEIGSDLLDEWADLFANLLGFGDASSRLRRYHAVAVVLAWAAQNRSLFVNDLVEAER
jgi:hypothetical protein